MIELMRTMSSESGEDFDELIGIMPEDALDVWFAEAIATFKEFTINFTQRYCGGDRDMGSNATSAVSQLYLRPLVLVFLCPTAQNIKTRPNWLCLNKEAVDPEVFSAVPLPPSRSGPGKRPGGVDLTERQICSAC